MNIAEPRKPLLALLVLFTIIATPGFADDTPKEVVEKFCQYDFAGYRLSSSEYKKIEPLISYPAEPGWDIVIGIIGYKIIDAEIIENSAKIQVRYDIDRSWPDKIKDIEKFSVETFWLEMEKGAWRISKYIIYPRVSSDILCKKYRYCDSGS